MGIKELAKKKIGQLEGAASRKSEVNEKVLAELKEALKKGELHMVEVGGKQRIITTAQKERLGETKPGGSVKALASVKSEETKRRLEVKKAGGSADLGLKAPVRGVATLALPKPPKKKLR